MVTPVKYECDSNNLQATFARSNILLTEKLINGALVTPPLMNREMEWWTLRQTDNRQCPPAEVLSQLGNTSTPQISGSKSVACVAALGVLVAASGVICDSSLFSLEIALSTKLLTSDSAWMKTSVSLINQVAFVEQQHEAFGFPSQRDSNVDLWYSFVFSLN